MAQNEPAEHDTYTQIATTVAGISIIIVAIVAIFAQNQLWVVAPVVSVLVALGVILGYFSYRTQVAVSQGPIEQSADTETDNTTTKDEE